MKTQKGIREHDTDELRKAKRLEPLRKSGKDRHTLYNRYDDEEEEEYLRPKRESAFDYLDDEEVAPDGEASLADEDDEDDEDDDFDFEDDDDDEFDFEDDEDDESLENLEDDE